MPELEPVPIIKEQTKWARPLLQPRTRVNSDKMILRSVLLLLVASILLTGCAGNKIEGRKHERAAGYADLPVAQRQLVDGGRIDSGMPTNAVYIAWGKPARAVAVTAPGTFTWVYVCRDVQPYRAW